MTRLRVTLLVSILVLAATLQAVAMDRATLRWIRNKPAIKSIGIDGNDSFSDKEIRKRMYSRVRTFWGSLKGDRRTRVQRESFGRDTLEIKYFYLTRGFLGIQVKESFQVILPDSSARVMVTLNEGRCFKYGHQTIEGHFERRFENKFQKAIQRLKVGDPVNLFDLRQASFDIKTILANDGYPYAQVDFVLDTTLSDMTAQVRYTVESDSLVHFGEITIEGPDRYPTYTASRELKIKKGNVYRRYEIVESQRRVYESGYFSTLQLERANNLSDRLNPDFQLRVRERKPGYVTVKTGAGQSEYADLSWDFSVGVGKRNLFGSRRIDLLFDLVYGVGQKSQVIEHNYRLRYTEPWLAGIRMPLSLTFTYEPEVQHPVQDFRVQQWSASLSTFKRFSPRTKAIWGLEYQSVDISGVPRELEDEVRRQTEGLSVRQRLYLSLIRDSRDNIFVPSTGSMREMAIDYYGGFLGGDEDFVKMEVSWSGYHPVWPGWISATRIKGGWVDAFGKTGLVPSNDRLFLGGANTIRGFAENSLAPMESDSLPGAGFTVVVNQEFRWKTIQIFSPIPVLGDLFRNLPLWQSIFVDVGNGYRSINKFRFSDLAVAYGTGVQIHSPAGPIRVDYARHFRTPTIELGYRWHFTILYAF
ncbi:MAG: BamA/TamA family outer membrane protein [candidate division Zixibacteria bacterium]|nr:BamA/TamA family outer membrane protein [candidate division Zixibacteria bacterium]